MFSVRVVVLLLVQLLILEPFSACTQTLTFQSRFEQIRAFVRATLPDAKQQPQFSCSNPLVCVCIFCPDYRH
jgi:hypothetical protein